MGVTIFNAVCSAIKGLVFTLLLFFRPVVTGLMGLIGGLSLIGFLGILIFARQETTPMFAFLFSGIGAVGIAFGYDLVLMFLAPAGFTLILESK